MTYVTRDLWEQELKGWLIVDCAVRDRETVYLCLRKSYPHEKASLMFDHDIETTLFSLRLGQATPVYGATTVTGYNKPKLGVALLPGPQGLLASRNGDGQVHVVGPGKKFPNEFIDTGAWPMVERVKTLFGYAFSVGDRRKIYKRTAAGKWERFGSISPEDERNIADVGFNDMDAFSESDMYAVGGSGDVWHYDGKAWKQMGFPTNVALATVTCAGDGNVYVSGEGGSLWVGRESTWRRVHQGSSSVFWNDVLWFSGQLWLASDYQLRIWDGKSMQPVQDAGRDVAMSGHMDARDGLLVVAGTEFVKSFDGKQWTSVVAPYA